MIRVRLLTSAATGSHRRDPCREAFRWYAAAMSYQTLAVELENGRVHPSGADTLPAKAHALLTILSPAASEVANGTTRTLGDALRELEVQGRGVFTDLSTNRRHMDDFGK